MQQQSANLQRDITELIIWGAATPVLTVWALISLLPLVSVINVWGDFLPVLIALAFFATGALGLLSGFAGYRLLQPAYSVPSVTPRDVRVKRVALLAAYAAVWMALYAVYSAG